MLRQGAAAVILILAAGHLLRAALSEEEPLRLLSGREISLEGGRLRAADAQALLREAEKFLGRGRLDLALDNCRAVSQKGSGDAAAVSRLVAATDEAEKSTLVILKDGRSFKGRLRTPLRSDHLGLQGREEIPVWKIAEIGADYLINYSLVTKTFYLVTHLHIRFRDAPESSATLTEEIPIYIEEADGTVRELRLGYPYEMLRKEEMGEKMPQVIRDRVSRVIVYAALDEEAAAHVSGQD